MPELITIEEAARITGFPSEDIQYWAKSHKITSYSVTRDSRLVDLANLREFISHIEHLGIQKLYLQLIIEDKKEEADEIIAQHDDFLFCLRLRLENRNMEYELKSLYKKALESGLYIESPRSLVSIPQSAAKRICQPITNLTLSPYIRKCLAKLEIETIEDLLRYAKKKGLDSLLDMPGFGTLGLDQLKFQLEKHKILNKAGQSELYQYIINDPDY